MVKLSLFVFRPYLSINSFTETTVMPMFPPIPIAVLHLAHTLIK